MQYDQLQIGFQKDDRFSEVHIYHTYLRILIKKSMLWLEQNK